MTIHTILTMGDPRLLKTATLVHAQEFGSPRLLTLVTDLWDTMHAAKGVGLAAPQIGVDRQVVVLGTGQINPRYPQAPAVPPTVLCNPVIQALPMLGHHDDQPTMDEGWEGCLSVPGLRGMVSRYARIRFTGRDQHGHAVDQTVQGFHARVVQHECDHLWGILYPMKANKYKREPLGAFVDT